MKSLGYMKGDVHGHWPCCVRQFVFPCTGNKGHISS